MFFSVLWRALHENDLDDMMVKRQYADQQRN